MYCCSTYPSPLAAADRFSQELLYQDDTSTTAYDTDSPFPDWTEHSSLGEKECTAHMTYSVTASSTGWFDGNITGGRRRVCLSPLLLCSKIRSYVRFGRCGEIRRINPGSPVEKPREPACGNLLGWPAPAPLAPLCAPLCTCVLTYRSPYSSHTPSRRTLGSQSSYGAATDIFVVPTGVFLLRLQTGSAQAKGKTSNTKEIVPQLAHGTSQPNTHNPNFRAGCQRSAFDM